MRTSFICQYRQETLRLDGRENEARSRHGHSPRSSKSNWYIDKGLDNIQNTKTASTDTDIFHFSPCTSSLALLCFD